MTAIFFYVPQKMVDMEIVRRQRQEELLKQQESRILEKVRALDTDTHTHTQTHTHTHTPTATETRRKTSQKGSQERGKIETERRRGERENGIYSVSSTV